MNRLRVFSICMMLTGLVMALPQLASANNNGNVFCDGNLNGVITNILSSGVFNNLAGIGAWQHGSTNCWDYSGSLGTTNSPVYNVSADDLFVLGVNPAEDGFIPYTGNYGLYKYGIEQKFDHPANQVVDIGFLQYTVAGQTVPMNYEICFNEIGTSGLAALTCQTGSLSGSQNVEVVLPEPSSSGTDDLIISGQGLAVQYVTLGTNSSTPSPTPSTTPTVSPTPTGSPNQYCYLVTDCTWQGSRGQVNTPNHCFGTCTGGQWNGEQSNSNGNCSGGPFSGLLFWGTNCVMITEVVIPSGSTSWTAVWTDFNHNFLAGNLYLVDVTAGNTVLYNPVSLVCNGSTGVDNVPPTPNCSASGLSLPVGHTIALEFQDTAGGNLGAYWDLIGNAAATSTPTGTPTSPPTAGPTGTTTPTPFSYDGTRQPTPDNTPVVYTATPGTMTPTSTPTPCVVLNQNPNGWVNFIPCGGAAPTPCAGSNNACNTPQNSCQNTGFTWKPPDNLTPSGIANMFLVGGLVQATLWIVVGGWNLLGDLFIPQHINCDFTPLEHAALTKVAIPDLSTAMAPLATLMTTPCGYLGVRNIGFNRPRSNGEQTALPTPPPEVTANSDNFQMTQPISIGIDGCASPWITYLPLGRNMISFALWVWFVASTLFFLKSFFTSKSFE